MGVLKDAMDKRADSLLRKAWDSSLSNWKLAMASTVVARNREYWVDELKGMWKQALPFAGILSYTPEGS